jgi:nucleotide-binding universal stress UspA family protein
VKLASALNARIVMLHVVEPIGEMGTALMKNYLPADMVKKIHDEGIEEIHQQMHKRIEKFYEEELNSLTDSIKLDIEYVVAEGNHTDTILAESVKHKANMVVMGAENTFGRHSHTTQQVAKHSKIPVVVVPTGKKYV